MNDTSEINYSTQLIRDEAKAFLGNLPEVDRDFLSLIVDLGLDKKLDNGTYILCATRRPDALNQWMHYSRSGGFAIGIDTAHALDIFPTTASAGTYLGLGRAGWVNVIYDRTRQQAIIQRLFREMLAAHKAHPLAMSDKIWTSAIGTLRIAFKHTAFAAEEECRFVVSASTAGNPAIRFREGPNGITPYVHITSTQTVTTPHHGLVPGNSISKVVCGPGTQEQKTLAYEMVKRVLNASSLGGVDVSLSSVPYRF